MNEFNENVQEVNELPRPLNDLAGIECIECAADSINEFISGFWEGIKEAADDVSDFFKDLFDTIAEALGFKSDSADSTDVFTGYSDSAREYGLQECADSAKSIFTADVINGWGMMTLEARNEIVQQYAEALGEGLNINFKGIKWEEMPVSAVVTYTYGYNSGDGYLHLYTDFLSDPSMLIYLIDTVAHEARHQFQMEAIENPEKFGIDAETIKEWTVGRDVYTTNMPTAYDPWGYTYNPLEIDSKYFGESMVRELTKDLINS